MTTHNHPTASKARRLTAGKIWKSLRAFSLPVSVLPVVVAFAVAAEPGEWNLPVLLLAIPTVACFHLAGNLLNDYFDYARGVDRRTEDDRGRPGRLLVNRQLLPGDILTEALVFLGIALICSSGLLLMLGPGTLLFAIPAVVLLESYTGPPLHLKYRMLGEPAIFIVFGPLLMVGAGWALTGRLVGEVLLISIPVGLATTAVVAGNNYRDREEDLAAGIRTMGRLAGGNLSRVMYLTMVVLAAILPVAYWTGGIGPSGLLLTPLALLTVARPVRAIAAGRRIADIDAQTAQFSTTLMVLLLAAYLLRHLL
ncbi:MAG: prenyltransferase [Phycisphaerae bacterium]